MKSDNIIVNVNLWGTCIGKLSWDMEKHRSVFQFSNEYRNQGDIEKDEPRLHDNRPWLIFFSSF